MLFDVRNKSEMDLLGARFSKADSITREAYKAALRWRYHSACAVCRGVTACSSKVLARPLFKRTSVHLAGFHQQSDEQFGWG